MEPYERLCQRSEYAVRIGILVDGQAEYHTIPLTLQRIKTNAAWVGVLYCDIQPLSTPAQIAPGLADMPNALMLT